MIGARGAVAESVPSASLMKNTFRPGAVGDAISAAATAVAGFRNWPTYFVHYFGLTPQRYMEIRLRRERLRVRSVGHGAEFLSLYRLMFEEDEYRLRHYGLSAGETIIDIGAHIGWFTLSAAARVPRARILSYEPNPENYRLLLDNLRLNSLTGVLAFEMAVSDKIGTATLSVDKGPIARSTEGTLFPENLLSSGAQSSYRVATITLDEILRANGVERCALVKMDCEGAEHEILTAASDETLARIERLSVEAHFLNAQLGTRSLMALLAARGYRVEKGGRWGNIVYAVRT